MIDLDIAEVLIVLFLPVGQACRAEEGVGGISTKLKSMAIEVVTLGGDKTQFDRLRRAVDQTQLKGFAYRQKVCAVVDRAQSGTGSALQQTGGGDRQGED
ncbi:hypothetical protein D9M71_811220 [compost metagenome]